MRCNSSRAGRRHSIRQRRPTPRTESDPQ
jgi:hypothetical protein